jgi:hypothetical protein
MKLFVNLCVISLKWRLRWSAYEWFVLRPAYARDQAEMSAAFRQEANVHYGLLNSNLTEAQDYLGGFVKALFVRRLPDRFLESWWMAIVHDENHVVVEVTGDGALTILNGDAVQEK